MSDNGAHANAVVFEAEVVSTRSIILFFSRQL